MFRSVTTVVFVVVILARVGDRGLDRTDDDDDITDDGTEASDVLKVDDGDVIEDIPEDADVVDDDATEDVCVAADGLEVDDDDDNDPCLVLLVMMSAN